MQPPRNTRSVAIFAGLVQPSHSSGDAAFVAFAQRFGEIFAYAVFAAHAVEEGRLDDSGDAHGRGCEEDAEGGVGTDEEVLDWGVRGGFFFSFSFLFSSLFFLSPKKGEFIIGMRIPGEKGKKREKWGRGNEKLTYRYTPDKFPGVPSIDPETTCLGSNPS